MKKVIVWSLFCSLFNLEVNAACVGDEVHPMANLSVLVESSIGKKAGTREVTAAQDGLCRIVDKMDVEECPSPDGSHPTFYIYKKRHRAGSLPCLVFVHGGDWLSPTFKIEGPVDSISRYYNDSENITATLLPMIHALTEKGSAVATITYKNLEGMSIVNQIKKQVDVLLRQRYIDNNRIVIMGHSLGGYLALQLLANAPYRQWLNDIFMAVCIYAPFVNESYAGGIQCIPCSTNGEDFLEKNGFTGQYKEISFPNRLKWLEHDNLKPFLAICTAAYPFSDFAGLRNFITYEQEDMRAPELRDFEKPIFLFQGTGDTNTPPNQMQNLIETFRNIGFINWQLFVFPDSPHHVHRIRQSLDSGGQCNYWDGFRERLKVCGQATLEHRKTNFGKFIGDIWDILNGSIPNESSPDAAAILLREGSAATRKVVREVSAEYAYCRRLATDLARWYIKDEVDQRLKTHPPSAFLRNAIEESIHPEEVMDEDTQPTCCVLI